MGQGPRGRPIQVAGAESQLGAASEGRGMSRAAGDQGDHDHRPSLQRGLAAGRLALVS